MIWSTSKLGQALPKVGDVVVVRPSQQLYWKTRFGTAPNPSNFRAVVYEVVSTSMGAVLIAQPETGQSEGAASISWFDHSLEGKPGEDYASKSGGFKGFMAEFPFCKWCHKPLRRHIGGEFHYHWEHRDLEASPWGYANAWACSNGITIDGKWHVAEHPFISNDATNGAVFIPEHQQKFYQPKYESSITVYAPGYEVVECKKGRKFKNI